MSVISVKAFFITASGRTLEQLSQEAGFADPHKLVNEALTTYKICRDARQAGQVLVRYDSETDQASPIAHTDLDPAQPTQRIVNMLFPGDIGPAFEAEFQSRDIAGVLSAAFYLYDRLISERATGQQVALVDNPADIRLFKPLLQRKPL